MAKTTEEKIQTVQEQIQQLENQRKRLVQEQKEQERKARTKRLIERGAIVESLIDGAVMMTNEQIKAFLERAIQAVEAQTGLNGVQPKKGGTATKAAGGAWKNTVSEGNTEGNTEAIPIGEVG